MKSDGIIRQAIAVFIAVLGVYIVAYYAIEERRTRNGPWEIGFTNDATGAPVLRINQPRLALTNILIVFSGASGATTNPAATLSLAQPREVPFEVPFGQCVFMDATSLPGTLVFEMFGHEIQMLPRVLTIDKVEQPWKSDARLILQPAATTPSP